MKEAKKVQITEQICKQAQLMRRGGANQTEIGALLGVNPCTISRIEAAGFELGTYQANRKAQREKEKAARRNAVKLVYDPGIAEEYRKEQEAKAAEELPGQIEMELIEKKPQEMSDKVKLMRFQAAQVDKIVLKLDHINDTLSMILRVMRKE